MEMTYDWIWSLGVIDIGITSLTATGFGFVPYHRVVGMRPIFHFPISYEAHKHIRLTTRHGRKSPVSMSNLWSMELNIKNSRSIIL